MHDNIRLLAEGVMGVTERLETFKAETARDFQEVKAMLSPVAADRTTVFAFESTSTISTAKMSAGFRLNRLRGPSTLPAEPERSTSSFAPGIRPAS